MSAHSFLPPSGAKAWRKCAAWPSMNKRYPQEDSEASREGTAAHWVAWAMYAGHQVTEGQEAPNGMIVTLEMIEGAELLLSTIRDATLNESLWWIEHIVSIPRIHQDCFGTPDAWMIEGNVLTIVDYKFGHRFVDEYENEQLISYAAGLIELVEISDNIFDSDITLKFVIVQPRCYYRGETVRTWTCYVADIRGIINDLHRAAEAAYEEEPIATTNSECGDCGGRHACNVFQKAIYGDIDTSGRSVPFDLPPEAASLELTLLERAAQRIEGRITGLQQTVQANLKAGLPSPWHQLQPSYGRKAWSVPDEQVVVMGSLLGKDLTKPKVVTPNQAVKLGIDEAVIKAYSTTPSTGMKLVPFDPKNISRIFKR